MVVKNVGSALRYCLPQQVGKKIGEYWELIKPLIDFKYEVRWNSNLNCLYIQNQVIETRMNSMFELATQDEIDKLRTNTGSDSRQSDEDLQLDDLEVRNRFEYREAFKKLCKKHMENICFLQLLFESFPNNMIQIYVYFRILTKLCTSKVRCSSSVNGVWCCSWPVQLWRV